MPIKDWSKYPSNWKSEIRPAILKRANNRCEKCGVENYAIGYRSKDGVFYESGYIHSELENSGRDMFDDILSNCFDKKGNPTRPIKIVLTIAHIDHDVSNNNPSNLMALCQKHHLELDLNHHRENSIKTINKKKGLQSLF